MTIFNKFSGSMETNDQSEMLRLEKIVGNELNTCMSPPEPLHENRFNVSFLYDYSIPGDLCFIIYSENDVDYMDMMIWYDGSISFIELNTHTFKLPENHMELTKDVSERIVEILNMEIM